MTPSSTIRLGLALLAVLIAMPALSHGQSYDYQDYRDAGYFDEGFYDDDWFYDWYDTGFSEASRQQEYAQYYEEGNPRQLFEASRMSERQESGEETGRRNQ